MLDWDRLVLQPCEAAFGEVVTYLAGDGRTIQLTGIFNERFSATSYEDEQSVQSTHPMVSVRASQLPQQPGQAELFRIRGLLYQVTSVDADGMGDYRVHLRLANDDQ